MKKFLQGWLTVFFSCECEVIGIYLKFIFLSAILYMKILYHIPAV